MSKTKEPESRPGSLEESYQPTSTEDRGYTPLTHRPAGETPNFTPPQGSGNPSGSGESSDSGDSGGEGE